MQKTTFGTFKTTRYITEFDKHGNEIPLKNAKTLYYEKCIAKLNVPNILHIVS